jgi:hypothetical protein
MSPSPAAFVRLPRPAQLIPFLRHRVSRVELDFQRLLDRLRHRLYPETSPVLASYWLKTVYWSGYARDEWRELDRLLKRHLSGDFPIGESCRQALTDIRSWIRSSNPDNRKPEPPDPRLGLVFRPTLGSETLAPYTIRLLNTWLPQEVAQMLVSDSQPAGSEVAGVPVLAVGKALERLLLRERLAPATLEALLNPELAAPRFLYPADLEMLRDVVLFLLGQTAGVAPAVLPATFLGTPRDTRLSGDSPEAIDNAHIVDSSDGQELHIPIKPDQVMQILKEAPVGIGSLVVTADGRCWEAAQLQGGAEDVLVYRPHGRPRIDYSADHARLRVPWSESRPSWAGRVDFPYELEVFGRFWRVAQWENDGAHSWLHLVFARAVPVTMVPSAEPRNLRRCAPASTDLAWAELETALAAALARNEWEPIERLRREDLIPLGRAVFSLAQSAVSRSSVDTIQSGLRRIHFALGVLDSAYGLIPWRILPPAVRKRLQRSRLYSAVLELLQQVFGGLPALPADPPALRYLTRFAGR